MTEKAKLVVLTIDNVRIVKLDELNHSVEQFMVKEGKGKWQHKGYVGSIQKGLVFIIQNELLIDKSLEKETCEYLEQMQESNEKVLQALREVVTA